jgi:glycoside/pentoside/hexuronide:cation symporter, GPH family
MSASPGGTTAGAARLPLGVQLGFGSGDFAFNLFWQGTSLFLMYFYTDVMGLSPGSAGLVYFIAMAWDAVSDPMMGVMADRTRTRWGRYRPYLLFGAVPLAASYPVAFWDPGFEGAALFGWALFTHCLLRTTYTVVSIPFSSLTARVTGDAGARAALAGWRMIGAAAGGLTVSFVTPTLVQALGRGEEAQGYLLSASVIGVISIFIFLFCFSVMREPAEPPGASRAQEKLSLGKELAVFAGMLSTNGPLLRIFLLVTVSSIAGTMYSKCILYFFKYHLQATPDETRLALILGPLMLFVGVPVWVVAAQRTSKRLVALTCAMWAGLGYLAFYFNPSLDPRVTYAIMAFIAFGAAGNYVMFWAMLPDTVEYGEAKTGVRHEAKVFGFASFAQKAALGVNALLLGWLLEATGYVANTDLGEGTLNGIRLIMTMIPILGAISAVALLWRYPITAAYHRGLIDEIASNRAKASAKGATG